MIDLIAGPNTIDIDLPDGSTETVLAVEAKVDGAALLYRVGHEVTVLAPGQWTRFHVRKPIKAPAEVDAPKQTRSGRVGAR